MAKQSTGGYYAGPMIPNQGYGQQANIIGGTGGAIVYGQNPSSNALAGNLNAIRQAEQMRIAQQQAEAQQLAQSWRDNELEAAEGMLWADQLGAVEQQHVSEGQKLMQEGINPYESMNPRAVAFRRQRRDILNQRAYRKGIESQYVKTLDEIRKNPNKYRPDDIAKLNQWVSGTRISDAYAQNQQLPMLRERFDPAEALKGVRAVTSSTTDVKDGWKTKRTVIDRPQTEGLVLGQLMSSQGGMEFLSELTGGMDPTQVLSIPDSRADIVEALKQGYSENPGIREQLASIGVVGDNLVNQWANEEASKFVNAKKNLKSFLDRQVDAASSGVKLEESRTRDTTEERLRLQQINASIARAREARLAAGETPEQAAEEPVDLMIPYGPYNPEGNQPQVQARNYIPMSIPNRNFVGSEAIDLYTGRPTQIGESSADYSIVGVTQVPVSKNPITGGVPKGSLVQPGFASANPNSVEWKEVVHVTKGDGEDYFVDINRLPKNLTKDQKALVDRFKQAAGSSNTSGPQLSAEELIRKYSQ